MQPDQLLSVAVLGKIALIESMIPVLPSKDKILDFVCRGLEDIPGVVRVDYSNGRGGADEKSPIGDGLTLCTFAVKINDDEHGGLLFMVSDENALAPYNPFIQNLSNMLGTIFGERHQRSLNESILANLESLVNQRTKELQVEIDERKSAEEARAESLEQYRSLAENTQDYIMRYDRQCRHLYQNAAAYRVSGFTKEEFVGKTHRELGFEEDLCELWEDQINWVFEAGESVSEVFEWEGKDGKVFLDWRLFPEFGKGGKVETVLAVSRDITDRKEAEEQQKKMEEALRETQKLESLGVMAGGIAHDFNNLLMAILGNADLAQMELSPLSPAHERIENMISAARRAADLCRQMLAYSGKGRFVIEAIDLRQIIEETSHMLEVSVSKKAILKYNFADNVPAIKADATQMRQIIMNLITNASEAIGNRSGVISISTGAMECDAAYLGETYLDEKLQTGVYSYYEVADTGCGMTEETKEKLF
ncbi:MAG: PAS domain S-box protein, partial [Halieaceae bacterium]|nr:PAS domain S-box protein [Halieaceae bacterium]